MIVSRLGDTIGAEALKTYRVGKAGLTVPRMLLDTSGMTQMIAVQQAMTAVVAAPPQIITTESVPLSDPRHPQHAEWLAQQADDGSFITRYGLWVGLGAAAVIVAIVLRRPRAVAPTPPRAA